MAPTMDFTEAGTSRTIEAGEMSIHYHDVGQGDPVVFLHSYGPGTTAWITFYKTLDVLAKHFRCLLLDLPNFGRTGPLRRFPEIILPSRLSVGPGSSSSPQLHSVAMRLRLLLDPEPPIRRDTG